MDLELIQRLIALMKEGELTEFEWEEEERKIRLSKRQDSGGTVTYAPAPVAAAAPMAPAVASAPAPAPAPAESPAEEDPNSFTFTAPMVGTYYAAPSPEAPAFVKVGDSVGAETVLCILEAMKVMNEIKAECSGEITRILVQDGEPVEFGQPLFKLRQS